GAILRIRFGHDGPFQDTRSGGGCVVGGASGNSYWRNILSISGKTVSVEDCCGRVGIRTRTSLPNGTRDFKCNRYVSTLCGHYANPKNSNVLKRGSERDTPIRQRRTVRFW